MLLETGYIGLKPTDTRPSDKICILFGGRAPLVLREMSKQVEIDGINQNCHILIRDSYFHGLMKGEAVKMTDKQEMKA